MLISIQYYWCCFRIFCDESFFAIGNCCCWFIELFSFLYFIKLCLAGPIFNRKFLWHRQCIWQQKDECKSDFIVICGMEQEAFFYSCMMVFLWRINHTICWFARIRYTPSEIISVPRWNEALSILRMSQSILILKLSLLFQKIGHLILYKIGIERFLQKLHERN